MKILAAESQGREEAHISTSPAVAWRWLGWFGFALAAMGFGDIALSWVPPGVGSPQWEFGTIGATFASLPLASIGLAGLVASALTSGRRWLVALLAAVLLTLGVAVLAGCVVFLLDTPLALHATQGLAKLAVKKAIIKTLMLGLGFGALYLVGGVAGFRLLRAKRH